MKKVLWIAVAWAALWAMPARAQSFSIAQTCSNNSTTATASQTCTFGGAETVGNLIVAQAQCDTNASLDIPTGFSTPSDGGTTNTYTQRYSQTATPSQAMAWAVWTAVVTQANTVITFAPTFSLGTTCTSGMTTIGTEFHATSGTMSVDQVATIASFTSGSSPWTSNAVTNSQANEILVGVFYDDNGGGSAPTVGTGYTNFMTKKNQFYYQGRETKTVSSSASQTASIVDTGGVSQIFIGLVTIQSPSGSSVKRLRGSVVTR